MSPKRDPKRRISNLREQIRRADHLYHNLGRPELTDAEYDALYRELQELEAAHPDLCTPDSPTQRVGAPLAKGQGFTTAPHLAPMLSIDALPDADALREFEARTRKALALPEDEPLQLAVEPKLDGVSANLLYEDGVLVRGLTRGDGTQGEDVTRNLRTIANLPLRLLGEGPFPGRIEVRGEVILSRSAFTRLQEAAETTMESPFRNPRNAAAGTLKQLDPRVTAQRELEFIAWGVGHAEGLEAPTWSALRAQLAAWGFKVTEPFAVSPGIDGVIEMHNDLERRRDQIEYEMDGVVAKVDRIDLQRRLGRTARTPRWALAYKFAPRRAVTKVLRILASVGRTGAVTPVAELEPVELAGVTVRRATLHNWGLLQKRDVREGDTVEIERAGDVIPEVLQPLLERRSPDSQPAAVPTQCPTCGSALTAEGAFLSCSNLECPDQVRGRIVHMSSRRALDIERLGPKYVDQLLEAGLIRHPEDVFTLPEKRDAILALERWGERSYEKLAAELEKAKRPTLARFLYGLGIRQVGEQTAKDLAEHFGTLAALEQASEEQLIEVEGVGPEVAASVHRFFALEGNQRFLAAARAAGVQVVGRQTGQGPLAGRVFCFTGGLAKLSRDEARAIAEELGARTTASLSKQVTHVVAGEGAGAKLEKAKKLELEVMDEQQFLQLVGRA